MPDDVSSQHKLVLEGLRNLQVEGCAPTVIEQRKGPAEEDKGRIPLPLDLWRRNLIPEPPSTITGERKQILCHTDALVVGQATNLPRVLIELVKSNPNKPNGIVGVTINADRIAGVCNKATGHNPANRLPIDLVFILLADELTQYPCNFLPDCGGGHKFKTNRFMPHWIRLRGDNPTDETLLNLIHSGDPEPFKKALIDFPIGCYLRWISPPIVIVLNKVKIARGNAMDDERALNFIQEVINDVVTGGRREATKIVGLRELIPSEYLA